MRRCMSDRVGKVGRVVPSKGLDFMVCLLARFRIGVGTHWSVGVVVEGRRNPDIDETAGPGAAFYKRWSGISIRWLKGVFSFLSARLRVPGKLGPEDAPVGDSQLRGYCRILLASMAFARNMRMEGSLTGD
jgi:hypothetical protein